MLVDVVIEKGNAGWREASVDLGEGYQVTGPGWRPTRGRHALVAFEGGFAHLEIPGIEVVQTVSAPAVLLVAFRSGQDSTEV